MRQEEWSLATNDGHKIYGVTNYAEGEHAKKCLVLVHGLTGNKDEHLHISTARFFKTKGYDVIRFSLYSEEADARRLRDCTLQTHAKDLNSVLSEKTSSYIKLYLIGHSYGAPTIMVAQPQNANAISLWDPAFNHPAVFVPERVPIKQENGFYLWGNGTEKILGADFVHETQTRYDTNECLELSKALSHVPIQVLHAEEFIYFNEEVCWHSAGHPQNERHLVKGADHCFFRGDSLQKVQDHSYTWFERF